MEKLIDIFCHAIRITDPLSIKIAIGVIGGGLPLFLVCALLIKLGEIVARQREATTPSIPARQKKTPWSSLCRRRKVAGPSPERRVIADVLFAPKTLWANSRHLPNVN